MGTMPILSKRLFTRLFRLVPPSLVALAFLSGCTDNPFDSSKAKGGENNTDSSFILAQGLLEGSAKAAADLHQEVAAGDRVEERQSASAEAQVKPEVGLKSIGPAKGDPNLSKGTQPKSVAAGALLKRAYSLALGKRSASGDSSTLVLSDSAAGFIYSLRVYVFVDSSSGGAPRPGKGRDSTVLKWPHNPGNPAVLGFHRQRAFDDGVVERSAAYDDDGDGLLSEAPAGKRVRLRRIWLTTHGDSLWKSVVLTQHGQTTHFDSLGDGDAQTWTDTAFVGGKVAWWRKVYDGDGDGFAATAAPGSKVRIRSDNFSILADGTFRYGFDTHGPGPDGDYGKDADNEHYAASSMTVNSKGEDVSRSERGDADGDGLLWSPAAGAVNRVWETAAYFRRTDMKSYKDSLVKVLGTRREADARVVHYGAAYERMDGTMVAVSVAAMDGKTAFGPADTVLVSERMVHAAGDEELRDSTVRMAHMIPGHLDTEEDDKLLWWAVKVFHRTGSPVVMRSESFASAAPMAPGTEAAAGSLVVEETRRGDGPNDVVRVWKRNDFDRDAGTAAWREIRNTKSGDSTVTGGTKSAAGGGTYVTHAGKGLKQTGWYDPATGAFRDTVMWIDAKGMPAGRLASEGTLKNGTGTLRRSLVRADGKSIEVTVSSAKGLDGSLSVTRIAGKDTTVYKAHGDTTTLEKVLGAAKVTFALARMESQSYSLALLGKDLAGTLLIRGVMTFLPGGTGDGELIEYAKGDAKPRISFHSEPDGDVIVGGVKLP